MKIHVKHPTESCNTEQETFINSLADDEAKKFHSLLFSYGNAVGWYHQINITPTEEDYQEWLEGLPANVSAGMKEKGFDQCKTILPFSRYVREKRDIHQEDFVKDKMGLECYNEYRKLVEKKVEF